MIGGQGIYQKSVTVDRSFDVARPVKPIGRQDREGEVYMSDGKVRCALVTGG